MANDDKINIPKKGVDSEVQTLSRALERGGIDGREAYLIAQEVSQHRLKNDLPKWLEVERWGQRLVDKPAALSLFDCFIDPTLSANNPTAHLYTNIGDAVVTEQPTHTSLLRIGVIPNGASTPINDQQQILTWPTWTSIEVVSFSTYGAPSASTPLAIWNHNNKRHSAPVQLACKDLQIQPGPGTAIGQALWATGGQNQAIFVDCYIIGTSVVDLNGTNAMNVVGGSNAQLFARNTHFMDCSSGGVQVTLDLCHVDHNYTVQSSWGDSSNPINASVVMKDCTITHRNPNLPPSFSKILLGGTINVLLNPHKDNEVQYNTLTSIIVPQQNNARLVVLGAATIGVNNDNGFSINTTGKNVMVTAEGSFTDITLAVPMTGRWHSVTGNCGTCDVTGPALVDVACKDSVTIRGDGVSGSVSTGNNGMTYVGARGSCILASIYTATVGLKPYAFDAASSRNVLVIGGTNNFTVAGTDAGTANRIITNLGSPGIDTTAIHSGDAAGGQLSGTYPNPNVPARAGIDTTAIHTGDAASGDLAGTYPSPTIKQDNSTLKNWQQEFQGAYKKQTYPAPTPGSTPTGAAGGSLAGTYPNPTFAGRDASVDKLLQDFTQGFISNFERHRIGGSDPEDRRAQGKQDYTSAFLLMGG